MKDIIHWVIENQEFLYVIAGLLVGILRMTVWGKSNKAALDFVTEQIETHQDPAIKAKIKDGMGQLKSNTVDALTDAVDKADPKKETPSAKKIIAREALKTVGAEKLLGKK